MSKIDGTKRRRSPLKIVERDFHDAIDRMVGGRPKSFRLKRLAAEGRLFINPTTVAEEAMRSRTLIALEDCRLPSVRNRILELSHAKEVTIPRSSAEVISSLREQNIELQRALSASLECQQEHFMARERAEREAAKWRDAFKREQDHAKEDGKILPLWQRSGEKR